jgi:hypothetical protein
VYPYRVFICYSHNEDAAIRIDRHIESLGARPFLDRKIPGGTEFNKVIRASIGSAHIFAPVLTPDWKERP